MGTTARRDARIGPTAHYTAYVWHRLGLPHARAFATARGRALYWALRCTLELPLTLARDVPRMTEYLEMRHVTLEREIEALDPDVVVEIGAGLSRRGVTFAADRGVRYVEVDLPHMVEAKRRLVEKLPDDVRRRALAGLEQASFDVLDDGFGEWLSRRIAGAKRPVVVAEGLLAYFDFAERARLVRAVREAFRRSGGEGAMLVDLRHREGGPVVEFAAEALRGAIRIATRGRGAGPDYPTLDAARGLFLDAGFARAESRGVEHLPHMAHLRVPSRIWIARG